MKTLFLLFGNLNENAFEAYQTHCDDSIIPLLMDCYEVKNLRINMENSQVINLLRQLLAIIKRKYNNY